MPDKDSEPVRPGNDEKEKEAVIPAPPATPPLPETKFPIQFNQQVNFYQIPQNAWDRLSPQQTMDLTKLVLEQADATDRRHFEYAMNQARLDDRGKKLAMILGAIISAAGFVGSYLLSTHGHELAAVSISLPLATILAVIVGNRFLG